MSTDKKSPETIAAHANTEADPITGAIGPAIQPSTTFVRDENYVLTNSQHSYSRDENPSYLAAERTLATLEGATSAFLFSSGMAAGSAVISCLRYGDHVVAPHVMYWGLRNWMTIFCERFGIELEMFDPADPDGAAKLVRKGKTRLLWIETPCNPTWDVIDIARSAEVAHAAGAKLVVDSTAATPVFTRPIEYGADIVMHSATKYLNGHSDVVAGALATANNDDFWQDIRQARFQGGAVLGTFEAWLLQRGMRTLFLRVRQQSESAMLIAKHFANHSNLKQVLYPGLSTHPGHETAGRQMQGGFGGMLSFLVKGGREGALDFVKRCQLFARATSLGGVESLVEHRASVEEEGSPVPEDLVRISVGIEAIDDLIADLEQALG